MSESLTGKFGRPSSLTEVFPDAQKLQSVVRPPALVIEPDPSEDSKAITRITQTV